MGCGKNCVESSSHQQTHTKTCTGCIAEVVKTIEKLQNRAIRHDDRCPTSCFLEPIGGLTNQSRQANTRLFMLLDELGRPFKVVFMDEENNIQFTPLFRVEDIFNGHCATLRAVAPIQADGTTIVNLVDPATNNLIPQNFMQIDNYELTNTCVTVDLNDFTAIQCVADVNLNI